MTKQASRTVLITGGSSGIGFAMAQQMAAQGDRVIICGRSPEKLATAKTRVPQLVTIVCDITSADDRAALYQQIATSYHELNMLVNNAGIVKRYLLSDSTDLHTPIVEEWQTNFLAPVLLTQQFLALLAKNRGTVVNVTSGLAYVPLAIEPSYCASKAALHSMTRSMRVQFAQLGVRVVEIAYPAVDTPFQSGHAPKNAIKPNEAAAIALRRLNSGAEEIRVKLAGLLFTLNRLMPARTVRLLNRMIDVPQTELAAQR
jgi:uncharacterized oxidoreductase